MLRLSDLLECCVLSTTKPSAYLDKAELDRRHFYFLDSKGYCSSGFARLVALDAMLGISNSFHHYKWMSTVREALKDETLSPPQIGFYKEKYVLAQLCGTECQRIDRQLKDLSTPTYKHMSEEAPVTMFDSPIKLDFFKHNKIVLVPHAFNHPAIDGMVATRYETNKKKLAESKVIYVYPIQVTVASEHKDSEYDFIAFQREWQDVNPDWAFVWKFIWICNPKLTIKWEVDRVQKSELLVGPQQEDRRQDTVGHPMRRRYCNINSFMPKPL